ncbi:FkbM family methyltransferase [Vannielia sp.]|uniref:FkbM family methyltransferase n=1 Tax=Vannielia sp. TaxID=2813045 RepID=UPI002618F8B7|nr:FkbM family methyltransferase [Vannielia sp.]MDF1872087.1 FkbM family methyltransferase [Vannielia sp.]
MAIGPQQRAKWLIKQLELEAPLQIADIGARISNEKPVYRRILQLEAGKLHAFEPEPKAFKELEESKPDYATLYNVAVGKPGKATFFAHHIGSLSSIFKFAPACAEYLNKGFWVKRPITEMEVELVALDEVEGFPKLDILKMDVQGAELDIMQGGMKTLAETVMVIPEVRFYRMYQDEPMWADLDGEMRKQGFVLHKFLHQKTVTLRSRRWKKFAKGAGSQLLDGDAVYIRNLEAPEKVSTHQLKALALAADALCQSYDLCAFCLEQLVQREVLEPKVIAAYVNRLPAEVLAPEDDKVNA